MKYLITGGCGFLGSNIARELIVRGENVVVFDNLSRVGSIENLNWLHKEAKFVFVHGDIRNANDVERTIKKHRPDVVYHLAGQVAMTTSISNPRLDFEVNAVGSFNLLDAVRMFSPESIVVYSSTNKVYGDLEQYSYRETETRYECVDFPNGFNESVPLDFHSPYGTSKGSADQYMLDFHRIYGIPTVVFRHSSMYGGRQFATYDQGWVGWFTAKAVQIKRGELKKPFTISGNGKQVRDLLFVSDTVDLYLRVPDSITMLQGRAFNVGGGIENSCSLIELFRMLEERLTVQMKFEKLPARESDQRLFIADNAKVRHATSWAPQVTRSAGIDNMLQWISEM